MKRQIAIFTKTNKARKNIQSLARAIALAAVSTLDLQTPSLVAQIPVVPYHPPPGGGRLPAPNPPADRDGDGRDRRGERNEDADNFWRTTGNAGTVPGANFLGTTDNKPLELKVKGQRALRLEPNTNGAPNVIGGAGVNFVVPGVVGAVIAGGGLGNTAGGFYATVSGGVFNTARGTSSFAAGRRAKANQDGAFVWADSRDVDFASSAPNQFAARCTGGAAFVTGIDSLGNATAGVMVPSGSGSWSSLSDRKAKENLHTVDAQAVLARVAAMPISSWNYKAQDSSIRHIGPMAQDFYAAFNVGEDDKHIGTVDADGVALAAIQGLNQKVEERDAEIRELKARLERLEQFVNSVNRKAK